MLIAEYTFGSALLTVLSIFIFMAWILVLFTILGDLFRDHDVSGFGKAVWVLFLIFLPFLTGLIYLLVRGGGMSKRAIASQKEAQEHFQDYVRQTAGSGTSSADEIAKLADLRDKGTISADEFEAAKAKALA
jgi:Short C-terminal domain/Phospholipase_D-nuclease N-terminal